VNDNIQGTLSESELREMRLQMLLNNCKEAVLQQIIGPFGLTPAMFTDKQGGNVTTQHNADKGIFADESENYNRNDYDFSIAKKAKMQESIKNKTINSSNFKDEYTGRTEPTKRTTASGKKVMNAELDHTIPLSELHRKGGWMLNKKNRTKLASEKDNLHYTTMKNNRKKSNQAAERALSIENGYDSSITQSIIKKATEAVEKHIPTDIDRWKYHGIKLTINGLKETGKCALRQALGLLLYEFANESFISLKALLLTPSNKSLIDRLIVAFNQIAERITSKHEDVLHAALQGGKQGFISNFLIFIINSLITTSAKVVTIIREGMIGLFKSIKLLVNPPKDQSFSDVCREVTKILSTIITTSLGMLLEKSIEGFFISFFPLLIPVAKEIASIFTGLLTGLSIALIIYGIDRIFDKFLIKKTELLQTQEAYLDSMNNNIYLIASWIESEYKCSTLYQQITKDYIEIENKLLMAIDLSFQTLDSSSRMIKSRNSAIENLEQKIEKYQNRQDEIDRLIQSFD